MSINRNSISIMESKITQNKKSGKDKALKL